MAAILLAAAAAALVPAALRREGSPRKVSGTRQRIVSLAPNVTEILFELGLGRDVVGATRFCLYPPEAARLPRVGGLLDANVEAIVSLAPDLVVLLECHESLRVVLGDLGIELLVVRNETIGDILDSITLIGSRCGVSGRAAALCATLERCFETIRRAAAGVERPDVLVVVSRDYLTPPTRVYAAGRGTFYDELLEAAGGRNVLTAEAPAYPELSLEGLLRLDPGVIIEIVAEDAARGLDPGLLARDWSAIERLRAVADGRVIVMKEDYVSVPGPRFVRLLEEFFAALHPGRPRPGGASEPRAR